jgi:very-short-patch-repair endonuclease
MRKAPNRIDLNFEELRILYESGKSVLALAKHYGCARNVITRHLSLLGISQRNRSEAMYTRHSFLDYEGRKALAAAAHQSVRGKSQKQSTREKIAISKFWNQKSVSPYQVQVQTALWLFGVTTVREYPLGRFNLDLAECSGKTAIEIHGGKWHRYGKHWARRETRINALATAGWRTIEVWTAGDKYWDPKAVASALAEIIYSPMAAAHIQLGCDGSKARPVIAEGAGTSDVDISEQRDVTTGRYTRYSCT